MSKRRPTQAELELWQLIAKTAQPLPSRRRRRRAVEAQAEAAAAATPAETAKKSAKAAKSKAASLLPPAPPPVPLAKIHDLSHGVTIGIDRRQADRFRQGRLEIDGKIDLHGRTQAEAHDALHAFIHRAHRAGKRCLLVITGKGGVKLAGVGSSEERTRGILRQAVPRWLNEPGLRRYILAFDHARPQHGGEGALYVLLKRDR
ncbi:Smr/MutS family protein [Dongia soli]|uniref:Smr/MutS family protein n=1 Tax=Dongia soli TaxID=600628 RepID=A0ABU5E6R3_9PROT|nr:Smr/MutS family protein [Dongia soli]MDY0881997.1 Smr/MutS family protein [Dongia soli]